MCKYSPMFKSGVVSSLIPIAKAKNEINWAKKFLQKEDRIIWFLRMFRYNFINDLRINRDNRDNESIDRYLEKEKVKHPYLGHDKYSFASKHCDAREKLEHYYSLNCIAINEITLYKQPLPEMMDFFNKKEFEWRKRLTREIDEFGTPVLTVGEYTWFDLERSVSRREGYSMGHCGNFQRHGQNLYSLRSRSNLNKDKWIPHVTLVLNGIKTKGGAGWTGEIKGYANKKPSEKYHPAIIKFLELDIVTAVKGGGYLPQNNFELADLDHAQKKHIFNVKPLLHCASELLNFNKGKANNLILGAIARDWRDALVCEDYKNINDESMLEVFNCSLDEFTNVYDLPVFKAYSRILLGDDASEDIISEVRCDAEVLVNRIAKNYSVNVDVSCSWEFDQISCHISLKDFLSLSNKALKEKGGSWCDYSIEKMVDLCECYLIKKHCEDLELIDIPNSHPELLDLTRNLQLTNGILTAEIINLAESILKKENIKIGVGNEFGPTVPYIEIFQGDLEDLASTFDLENLKQYANCFKEGFFEFACYAESAYDFSEVKQLFQKVLTDETNSRLSMTLINAINDSCDELDIVVPKCLSDGGYIALIEQCIEQGDEIFNSIVSIACNSAEEAGAYSELYEGVKESVSGVFEALNSVFSLKDMEEITIQVPLTVCIEFFISAYNDYYSTWSVNDDVVDFEEFIIEHITSVLQEDCDLSVPYNGFQGFCEEEAEYRIIEEIDNISSENIQEAA